MLETGVAAPPFTLTDHHGQPVALTDFAGQWLVLWWYPQASSEVCTVQGRAFVPLAARFAEIGARLVGISFNNPEENARFAAAEGMDFPLLSDEAGTTGAAYEVTRNPDEPFPDKPRRITYLIDPQQTIARSYLVTDAAGHAEAVLTDLRALRAQTGER